jgi:NhaP-type Na+/H+ or K+/H+ antiporter
VKYGLFLLAGFLFLYAVTSRRLSRTAITGPMLFVTFGILTGPEVLDIIDIELDTEIINILLESTLILVLFTDALSINTSRWREEASVPVRLLGIGLPLTIAAGTLVALALFADLDIWQAALIGVILAPTDAALGQAVVSNPRVPERIRQGLNVESGLNDGIALPIFIVVLEAAAVAEASVSITGVATEIGKEVIYALVIGAAIGWVGALVIKWTAEREWVGLHWRQVSLPALAFGAWALADSVGGSGFIAAWIAGFAVGRVLREGFTRIHGFSEETSQVLTLLSFFVFGSVILGPALSDLDWRLFLYAVLSLTIVRMIPVVLSMLGSGVKRPSVAYMGWFGPRGLASIILALIVVEETNLPAAELIGLVMAVTVGLSCYAHGATAWWGSNRYADWYEEMKAEEPEMEEAMEMPEMRVSARLGPTA